MGSSVEAAGKHVRALTSPHVGLPGRGSGHTKPTSVQTKRRLEGGRGESLACQRDPCPRCVRCSARRTNCSKGAERPGKAGRGCSTLGWLTTKGGRSPSSNALPSLVTRQHMARVRCPWLKR